MKSAVFYGKHDLRVEEQPMPEVGPKDVLIQVKACGVCGTDVHIYEGDKGAAEVTPPTILGHEFAGVITRVGSEVVQFQPEIGSASTQLLLRRLRALPERRGAFLRAHDRIRHHRQRRICPVTAPSMSGRCTGWRTHLL